MDWTQKEVWIMRAIGSLAILILATTQSVHADELYDCTYINGEAFKGGSKFVISVKGEDATLFHDDEAFDPEIDYYTYTVFLNQKDFGFRAVRLSSSSSNQLYNIILGGELTLSKQEGVISAVATYSNSLALDFGGMGMRCTEVEQE